MNTRRNTARRLEEEVANVGAPPHDDKAPSLEKNANVDQAPVNPPPMTEAEKRDILAQMAQDMTTQAQSTTVQAQAMTAQANRDVAPCPHQQVTTMSSLLRDFSDEPSYFLWV